MTESRLPTRGEGADPPALHADLRPSRLTLGTVLARRSRQLGRLTIALVVFTMSALLGLAGPLFAGWLRGRGQLDGELFEFLLSWGSLSLGGGALLLVLKDLVKEVPSLIDYVTQKSKSALLRPALLIAVTSLGVSAAVLGALNAPAPATGSRVTLAPSFDPGRAHFFVTFSEDATQETVWAGQGSGLDIEPAYRNLLLSLGRSLTACSQDGARPSVEIIGMASSGPLQPLSDSTSGRLNLELANLRARRVAEELRSSVGDTTGVTVWVKEWMSYEQMVQFQGFADRDKTGRYDPARGLLNRRVDVVVTNAGLCEVPRPRGG